MSTISGTLHMYPSSILPWTYGSRETLTSTIFLKSVLQKVVRECMNATSFKPVWSSPVLMVKIISTVRLLQLTCSQFHGMSKFSGFPASLRCVGRLIWLLSTPLPHQHYCLGVPSGVFLLHGQGRIGELLLAGFQDVAFLPLRASFFFTTFFIHCCRGESFRTTTCLKTVVGVCKDMLPVKYFCSNKACFLCQSNLTETIRLSQGWGGSDQPQFWGYCRI